MRRRAGRWALLIGTLLALSSLVWFVLIHREESRAGRASEMIVKNIKKIEIVPLDAPEDGEEDNRPRLIASDGHLYTGLLHIPALSLELPINNECSDKNLKDSPCRYYGELGASLVICAHNYQSHFGKIHSLTPGDPVTITDAAGRVHTYTVELVSTLSGDDVEGMIESPYDLTLFTCTQSRTERVTVRCTSSEEARIGGEQEDAPAPDETDDADAPKAPSFTISYASETIRLRKGYQYSVDGGAQYTPVTDEKGLTLDISDCISHSVPVTIQKCATDNKPASKAQTINPLPRAVLNGLTLTPQRGKLKLDRVYEVFNPSTQRWGDMPKVSGDTKLDIRIKHKPETAAQSGNAASLPGKLRIAYGEYEAGKTGIIAAEIIAPDSITP